MKKATTHIKKCIQKNATRNARPHPRRAVSLKNDDGTMSAALSFSASVSGARVAVKVGSRNDERARVYAAMEGN